MKKQFRLINKGKGLTYIEVENLEEVTPFEDVVALIDKEVNKRVLKEDNKSIVSNTEIAKLVRLNNTTDAEKPVSDAQAIADNLRLLKGTYTGDAKTLDDDIKGIDIKVNGIISNVEYGGSIIPTDTPDVKYAGKNVYWKAIEAGTYTNFGSKVVLSNSDATISRVDGVFTISQTPFTFDAYVKTADLVNNISEGGSDKPLSAEVGKQIGNELFKEQVSRFNSVGAVSLDWFLIRNEKFIEDGQLTAIKVKPFKAGKMKFQIVRRTTFKGDTELTSDFFIPIKTFTLDVTAGFKTYDVKALNLQVQKGDYLGINRESSSDNNPPMFDDATNILDYTWTTYTSGVLTTNTFTQLRAYNIAYGYELQYSTKEPRVITNKIIVGRNTDNYNSIKNTMEAITDNSFYNRYEIYVPNGNWFELDIRGKKYVKLVCESSLSVIYCDATSTDAKYVVPIGYPYASEVGKQIATVSSTLLHVIFVSNDLEMVGGTVKMIRGKYAAHIDASSFETVTFTNTRFVSEQSIHPVGTGIWAGQTFNFENCTFESYDSEFGVAIHNQANQTKGTEVNLVNCNWVGCSYLKLDELGSNQRDIINLVNPSCDTIKSVLIAAVPSNGTDSYWKDANGNTTNNPLNVPHCIEVKDNGANIDWVRVVFYFWSAYPNTYTRNINKVLSTSFNSYATKVKCTQAILKGEPVSIKRYGSPYIEVGKYEGVNSSNLFGIALENGEIGSTIYVTKKGKIAGTIVEGSPVTGTAAAKITFNDSTNKFKSTPTASITETIGEVVGNDINGLYFVKI